MENLTARAVSPTEQNLLKSCLHLVIDSEAFAIVAFKVNAVLNVSITLIAVVANVLVFPAIRNSNTLRAPSKLLLCNLVVTDLGVALVAQPIFVHFLLAKVRGGFSSSFSCSLTSFGGVAGATLSFISLMTMSAISMDRYIAFRFHLKYRETVTPKRVCVVIGIIWLLAILNVQTWLLNRKVYATLVFINVPILLVVTSLAYIRIYQGLRCRHGTKIIQDPPNPQRTVNNLDMAKYRRSATSMMWLYGIFILCYLPYLCAETLENFLHSALVTCVIEFGMTIAYFNSCLNPFVYCLRLPEIRAAVLLRIRKICGCQS